MNCPITKYPTNECFFFHNRLPRLFCPLKRDWEADAPPSLPRPTKSSTLAGGCSCIQFIYPLRKHSAIYRLFVTCVLSSVLRRFLSRILHVLPLYNECSVRIEALQSCNIYCKFVSYFFVYTSRLAYAVS